MDITSYSLYLASWEHLYLISDGVPAGLPNQLFSRQPWALILFENLYCDENGFFGEQNAAQVMGWTNSQLFCDLASSKYGILTPLRTRHSLPVDVASESFRAQLGYSVDEAVNRDDPALDELLFAHTRQALLQPFLDTHRLVLYDWPVSKLNDPVPLTMQQSVKDILEAEMRVVPLALDVFSELPPAYAALFDDLQKFEREPLRHLRSGRVGQEEYLKHLSINIRKHREIDLQLSEGLPKRLERILRLRERFGKRGGWKAVRDFLAAYDRVAPVEELADLKRTLDDKLKYCFKPLPSEFAKATVRLTKTLAKLHPVVHKVEIGAKVAKEIKPLTNLLRELITYFRGDFRRGRDGTA